MNIGGAIIYFLQKDNVKKVYGYEPFHDTFYRAEDNILRSGYQLEKEKDRIEIYNSGIGNKTEKRKLIYNAQMTCGLSTQTDVTQSAIEQYLKWELIDIGDNQKTEVLVLRLQ